MILEFLHKDIIGEALDAHIAKVFGPNEAENGFLNELQHLSSCTTPIAYFARCSLNTSMEEIKYSTSFVVKELNDTVTPFSDES